MAVLVAVAARVAVLVAVASARVVVLVAVATAGVLVVVAAREAVPVVVGGELGEAVLVGVPAAVRVRVADNRIANFYQFGNRIAIVKKLLRIGNSNYQRKVCTRVNILPTTSSLRLLLNTCGAKTCLNISFLDTTHHLKRKNDILVLISPLPPGFPQ